MVRIKLIKQIPYKGYVYNLEIEKNHSYCGNGIIFHNCDDILQDPTNELNFSIIEKINRIFMEQVMSLPKEGGEIHLVGTAQHQRDLFFKLKENPGWNWAEYKAIINEANKEVLWPELFSYERLKDIRENEIGDKAFNKEYSCTPVWSEDAYFKLDEIMDVVDKDLKIEKRPASEWKVGTIRLAIDIGKKRHPSHVVVFMIRNGIYTMLYEKFLVNMDYTNQIEFIKKLEEFYLIDEIRYDATRGEFESFAEQNIINRKIWKPIVFTQKIKYQMAANFSKLVTQKKIRLLNNQDMLNSILSVNNNLEAPEIETKFGISHGDAFWSISMAVYEAQSSGGYFS